MIGSRVADIPSLGWIGYSGEVLLQELPGLEKDAQQILSELSRVSVSPLACDMRPLLFDPVLSMNDLLEGRF